MDCVYEKSFYSDDSNCWETRWIVRGIGVASGVGNIIAIKSLYEENSAQGTRVEEALDYYHPNHRGDTVFSTDENGEKKAELKYDAFGKTTYASDASRIKYRFSGKEWDKNAQLYYYGFRWYDPEHGIWTTKEPLSIFAGDLNVYRMVFNNPVYFVDQYGLAWSWAFAGAATGLGALSGLVAGLAYQTVSVLKGNCFNGKAILAARNRVVPDKNELTLLLLIC